MNAPGFTMNGWHVTAIIGGFLLLVVGVDVSFAVAAYRTFPGEVSAHPYEDGLAYNHELARRTREASLGWSALAEGRALGTDHAVRVVMATRDARPLTGLTIEARLARPATEAGAQSLRLKETRPGLYEAGVSAAPGVWDLSFTARDRGGASFQGERRLQW